MNALSHNVIMADRKKLKYANGLYLGCRAAARALPQSGSLSTCSLPPMTGSLWLTRWANTRPLSSGWADRSSRSPRTARTTFPMDIDLSIDDEENPLSLKADFMLSLWS